MAANSQLTRLINETVLLTKRPDLVDATKQAVKSATLKCHTFEGNFFPKDLFETGVSFSSAAYLQSFEYKTLIPSWRALKYMRKTSLDISTGEYIGTQFLTVITPEQILDSYNVAKENVIYGAGSVLQIRSSTEEDKYLLGCYVYPQLTDEGFSSWVADDFEPAIIYDAAATIFKGIGFDEQAAMYRNDAAVWLQALKNGNTLIVGY